MKESKAFWWVYGACIVFVVSFWGFFIYVAHHFITKFW